MSGGVDGVDADVDVVADVQLVPAGGQEAARDGAAVDQAVVAEADVDERAEVRHVGDAAGQAVAQVSVAQRRHAATKQRLATVYNNNNNNNHLTASFPGRPG